MQFLYLVGALSLRGQVLPELEVSSLENRLLRGEHWAWGSSFFLLAILPSSRSAFRTPPSKSGGAFLKGWGVSVPLALYSLVLVENALHETRYFRGLERFDAEFVFEFHWFLHVEIVVVIEKIFNALFILLVVPEHCTVLHLL